MFRRFLIVLSIVLLISEVSAGSVSAVTIPDFPACYNPPDSIRALHNDGLHGVVGNVSEYRGKDTVYNVEGGNFLQCLCTDDGEGIQTAWWRASSLSETDIQTLKNQGWYYVLDGKLWGLDNIPYMAKNNEYACREGEKEENGGGEVLGASIGSFASLAATGDKVVVYSSIAIAAGVVFLLLGFFINRVKK